MRVSYPPGTLSIREAVNWLASREHDESAYWYAVHGGGAWRKICEAVRTRKLRAYILADGQSHEADPAQFAILQDYISIQTREPKFVAETARETIHFTDLGVLPVPPPRERRLSGPLFFVERDIEAVFGAEPEEPSKRGRKAKYDWAAIRAQMFKYMDEHGPFNNRTWHREKLIEKLLQFCVNKFGSEPARSTLAEYLPTWLKDWQSEKDGN
jgi:hypothetical protein